MVTDDVAVVEVSRGELGLVEGEVDGRAGRRTPVRRTRVSVQEVVVDVVGLAGPGGDADARRQTRPVPVEQVARNTRPQGLSEGVAVVEEGPVRHTVVAVVVAVRPTDTRQAVPVVPKTKEEGGEGQEQGLETGVSWGRRRLRLSADS